MTVIQLYNRISALPGNLQKKVAEYIDFLREEAHKSSKGKARIAGLATGMIKMKDNFDDPVEGFEEYM